MSAKSFSNLWWFFLARGLIAVLLGLIALLLPAETLAFFVLLLGAYLLVDGIFNMVSALKAKKENYE